MTAKRKVLPAVPESVRLMRQIRPLLHGHAPEEQGAALADLLAQWLVGFPNFMRAELLEIHVRTVRDLIAPNEHLAFEGKGHPMNLPASATHKQRRN